jgi:hypothetical protein
MDEAVIPLIYTSKGNLPVCDLVRTDGWDFTPTHIKYWSKYSLGGEVVRESAYLYQLPANVTLQIKQGSLNG